MHNVLINFAFTSSFFSKFVHLVIIIWATVTCPHSNPNSRPDFFIKSVWKRGGSLAHCHVTLVRLRTCLGGYSLKSWINCPFTVTLARYCFFLFSIIQRESIFGAVKLLYLHLIKWMHASCLQKRKYQKLRDKLAYKIWNVKLLSTIQDWWNGQEDRVTYYVQ